jgi:hypothetical protein
LIGAHVFAAERIHGDDTTVPVLASPKATTRRLWTYVRRPAVWWRGAPAAIFYYSRDRGASLPSSGVMRASCRRTWLSALDAAHDQSS